MFLWAYNKGLKIGVKYGRIYSGGGWKLGRLGSLHCMGLRGGEILYGRFAKKVFERQHRHHQCHHQHIHHHLHVLCSTISVTPISPKKNQGMARTFASLLRVKRQRKPTLTFPQTAPPTGEQIICQKFGCISLLLQYQAKKRLDTLQIF